MHFALKEDFIMKRFSALLLVLALAVVFTGCAKKLSKEQMIEKGKYLVSACGVLKEHTPLRDGKPDMSKFMSGSNVGYMGPWGVYFPKNLTPDSDTGIGLLTDDEIISEIKGDTGNVPGYFSDYYKNLNEEDLRCIMMYLKSLEPVVNKAPADLKPGEKVTTPVINLVPKVVTAEALKKVEKPAAKKAAAKTSTAKSTAKKASKKK